MNDGIRSLLPSNLMTESARALRATYEITPDIKLFRREFGYYCLDRWYSEGLSRDADFALEFGYDEPGNHPMYELGWCEAAFEPKFEVKVLEDRGDYEVEQDFAGRKVLYFKGRRSGFMPEYLDHPVKDLATFRDLCEWRMDPKTPKRYANFESRMAEAKAAAGKGLMISQRMIGGYMYLRSLMGPEGALYMFYDDPDLIHRCMETWFKLADAIIARHQEYVTLDEFFMGEDICYNKGPLISPDMIREFLFPYYRELIANIRKRQIDQDRKLHIQIDTDGYSVAVIDVYREIGMTAMSPFEVASGCDVVEVAKAYPDLAIFGGIDKRILAQGKDAIDAHVDRILPFMKKRGGYIPTCDHGVPEEVSLADYRYYRKRCLEFS